MAGWRAIDKKTRQCVEHPVLVLLAGTIYSIEELAVLSKSDILLSLYCLMQG